MSKSSINTLIKKCEVVSVNYNTPDLIKAQRNAIRKYIGNIPIRIIDGSSKRSLTSGPNFTVEYMGYNIHHGPGAEYAIKTSKYPWVLLMDSDRRPIRKGIMNCLRVVDKDTYMVCHKIETGPLTFTMLIRTAWYDRYNPFILHGAPFKETFKGMWRTEAMKHFPFEDYTNDTIGGTRKKFGMNLKSAINVEHIDKNIRKTNFVQPMREKRRAARLRKLQNYRKRRHTWNAGIRKEL
jgi:hypothetical protein